MNGDPHPPPPSHVVTAGHTHTLVITSLSHFLLDSFLQETGWQDFLWMHTETESDELNVWFFFFCESFAIRTVSVYFIAIFGHLWSLVQEAQIGHFTDCFMNVIHGKAVKRSGEDFKFRIRKSAVCRHTTLTQIPSAPPASNESHVTLHTLLVPIATLPTEQQLEAVSLTCREKPASL